MTDPKLAEALRELAAEVRSLVEPLATFTAHVQTCARCRTICPTGLRTLARAGDLAAVVQARLEPPEVP